MQITTNFFYLRLLAAILITVSGIGQVALLWFRDLTGAALIDAMTGVIYIIIGIGLQGQSRFTLFVAIVVPAAAAVLTLNSTPQGASDPLQIARLAIDFAVIACAAAVLLSTRR